MQSNLHLHSHYSDGTLWPDEIVQRAKKMKLKIIAITDHDTFGGIKEFLAAVYSTNLRGIVGIEIDCTSPVHGYDKEVLAYFPKGIYNHTAARMTVERRRRERRMMHYITCMIRDFNLSLSIPEILNQIYARKGAELIQKTTQYKSYFSLMKPDLWWFVSEKKTIYPSLPSISSFDEFRKRYFNKHDPMSWEGSLPPQLREKLRLEDILPFIQKDDGYAVLPHIATEFGRTYEELQQNLPKLEQFLTYARSLGVWGVELHYYQEFAHDPQLLTQVNQLVSDLAAPLGFHFTYGSDCHGPNTDSDTMGLFAGDFTEFS